MYAVPTAPSLCVTCEITFNVTSPEKAPAGPVSILFSSVDRTAYVYRNGVQIGRAPADIAAPIANSYVYSALDKTNPDGSHDWSALGSADGSGAPDLKAFSKHLAIAPEFLANARSVVTPGTTLIITNQPVNSSTKSAPGFNILTTAAETK